MDECDLGTDDCNTKPNSQCNNIDGGFECLCVTGYQKNAKDNCEGMYHSSMGPYFFQNKKNDIL